ncbi:hypothetical protein C8Q74DRAFT_1441004 [Fomes fomentarius]|nr:hypothetical protein C8Q74DRAFT_1441004 [Fomes fomentarius]
MFLTVFTGFVFNPNHVTRSMTVTPVRLPLTPFSLRLTHAHSLTFTIQYTMPGGYYAKYPTKSQEEPEEGQCLIFKFSCEIPSFISHSTLSFWLVVAIFFGLGVVLYAFVTGFLDVKERLWPHLFSKDHKNVDAPLKRHPRVPQPDLTDNSPSPSTQKALCVYRMRAEELKGVGRYRKEPITKEDGHGPAAAFRYNCDDYLLIPSSPTALLSVDHSSELTNRASVSQENASLETIADFRLVASAPYCPLSPVSHQIPVALHTSDKPAINFAPRLVPTLAPTIASERSEISVGESLVRGSCDPADDCVQLTIAPLAPFRQHVASSSFDDSIPEVVILSTQSDAIQVLDDFFQEPIQPATAAHSPPRASGDIPESTTFKELIVYLAETDSELGNDCPDSADQVDLYASNDSSDSGSGSDSEAGNLSINTDSLSESERSVSRAVPRSRWRAWAEMQGACEPSPLPAEDTILNTFQIVARSKASSKASPSKRLFLRAAGELAKPNTTTVGGNVHIGDTFLSAPASRSALAALSKNVDDDDSVRALPVGPAPVAPVSEAASEPILCISSPVVSFDYGTASGITKPAAQNNLHARSGRDTDSDSAAVNPNGDAQLEQPTKKFKKTRRGRNVKKRRLAFERAEAEAAAAAAAADAKLPPEKRTAELESADAKCTRERAAEASEWATLSEEVLWTWTPVPMVCAECGVAVPSLGVEV